jgi:hypothetical protein
MAHQAARGPDVLEVRDRGERIGLRFAEILKYCGPRSPAGVANAFKVLQRALPVLEPDGLCERRDIAIRTAFGGPGARDCFEMVTRAVTEGRWEIDPALGRPERGRALERFVFALSYRERRALLVLRAGYVTDEFIDLARTDPRTPGQERELDTLKRRLADRVMASPAAEVYDVEAPAAGGRAR